MHNTTSAHQKHRFHDHAKAPVQPADDDDVFVVVVAVVVPEDNAPRLLLGEHIVIACSTRFRVASDGSTTRIRARTNGNLRGDCNRSSVE